MVGWDADDNGDGHLDAPCDDPRNPPAEEGEPMAWHLTVTQLQRSGMWKAAADSDGYHFEFTAPAREQAVAQLRAQVDAFESAIGARS